MSKYRTEPFKIWNKAKELRMDVYRDYAQAHEKGGLRIGGGAWSFMPIAAGLGDDVYWLSSEPYSASVAHDIPFSKRAMAATENQGFARDLCGYIRNYWGSIILNEYVFGGPWPKADLLFEDHICCSHAKWYQRVREIEDPDIPYFCIDCTTGPYLISPDAEPLQKHKLEYLVNQLLDTIDQIDKLAQKKWNRKFDDEKFIEALNHDCNATSLWCDICCLNKNIPARMDEKSMFAFFNLAGNNRFRKSVTDFYKELYDEIQYRVDNQIAAVGNERIRIFGDSPPPWAFLNVYRYLETYGCVAVGSAYNIGIFGVWQWDENGVYRGRTTPEQAGIVMKTREDAVRVMADWYLSKAMWQHLYGPEPKIKIMLTIADQWKCDGALIHQNRGCEMSTLHSPEIRLALMDKGIKVATYEGNMGDFREFDIQSTKNRIDIFLESLGAKKIP